MTRGKKIAVLAVIGSVLALSVIAFVVLFCKYGRHEDPNNEDVILRRAEAAEREDNPPLAAFHRRRLTQLNPFNEEYREKYVRALVRVRDFDRLQALTNSTVTRFALTADEAKLERLMRHGSLMVLLGSNNEARIAFTQATNLNYYAAAPRMIDTQARLGRIDVAYVSARRYLERFPNPRMLILSAEWAACMNEPDLIDALVPIAGRLAERPAIVFTYYCTALKAWCKRDMKALKETLGAIPSEVTTPVGCMMALEVASVGDDPGLVESAYREVRKRLPFLDFDNRGNVMVKRFVAAHFPDKLPIEKLGKLADLVQGEADAEPDVELTRVSLLAKFAAKTLDPFELDKAVRLFPKDKGIQLLKAEYEQSGK